ncbi:DNA gyrase inhibitor YacG [Octadecabacter ascidiaceicola]|uniref:DNA gyrase inhibitor YacG n=1 Tax=Octadecabacter ascidiaceicola TaxID=1655543 RepID=A0A238KA23_9RHOB|nr:DNA gyrase inhibitor YacG [Octadecabacter ascidiaceicola]SMX39347.1 zinc-binding protein [Octadecabacter ascidiaceicola]
MACPICDKETNAAYRPFCSKRCADVDLAKWLGGGYAIPSNDPDEIDELEDALEKAKQDPELPRPS